MLLMTKFEYEGALHYKNCSNGKKINFAILFTLLNSYNLYIIALHILDILSNIFIQFL